MLIVATSGRAIAQSARRAGYLPLTVDFFGDLDTQEAGPSEVVEGDFSKGFDLNSLRRALRTVSAKRKPVALIYGSGLEAQACILNELENEARILGNSASTVRAVKDPYGFAMTCEALKLPHPQIQSVAPSDPRQWVYKMRGGAGGSHIKVAERNRGDGEGYYQRVISGRPVSALFVSDGTATRIIGFSEQWCDPTDGEPYRYGGAITPAALTKTQELALSSAVMALAKAFGLRGLNSADFMVDADGFHILEINPRPGATLDIFDDEHGGLVQMHIASFSGQLHSEPLATGGCRAAKILYAEDVIASIPAIQWPEWSADQQSPDTRIEAGWPICTILARSANQPDTFALLAEREAAIRRQLGGP